MRGDQPNYYKRKSESTNLDSRPGARKANADISRPDCDMGPVRNAWVPNGEITFSVSDVQETFRQVRRSLSIGAEIVSNPTDLGRVVPDRNFICPRCLRDMRFFIYCEPLEIQDRPRRMVFDPESVVDANPNRPELA